MNAKTLAAITKHGNDLLALFPDAVERDPVKLCKALRRVEVAISGPLLRACNTGDDEHLDKQCDAAMAKTIKLLGLTVRQAIACGLFINRDPRGYAIKLSDSWVRKQRDNGRTIHTDFGGYGIIAPDLTAE